MNILSKYFKKYWYAYAAAILCTVSAVYLDMLSPQITKRIIDHVIMEGKSELLSELLLIVLIIAVGRCILQYIKEVVFDLVGCRIAQNLRRSLFKHLQRLSLSFFDNNNTGELMSRVKDDVDRLWGAASYVSMLIIQVLVHTGFALYFMFTLSPSMAIIPSLVLPCIAALAILMERKLGSIYEQISEENSKLNLVAQENLSGVRTVKAFARERHEIMKFLSHNKKYYELNMKQSRVFIRIYPYFQLITKLLPMFVVIYGGYQVLDNRITLGTLGAFIEYSMNIVWPMEMFGWLSNDAAAAVASYKRIKKLFKETPLITDIENPIALKEVTGAIRFNNVSFSINDKSILSDISFELSPGKTIGIMGATGTGKSSIINLLQRFYDTSEGEILLDGVNIKELTLKQLRNSISLVMQDVFLFSDTINENVKMGNRYRIHQDEVTRAVEHAQAKDFIERMDGQYETIIGERGVGLSGGQKQRISIARALAKNSPILVMDDSTSALDMETEHEIQRALSEIKATKIIIAHRISAVKNADEILILEDGRIAERGTHDTLLQKKGYYYDTYMAQYGDYLNDVEAFPKNPNNKEVATCQ